MSTEPTRPTTSITVVQPAQHVEHSRSSPDDAVVDIEHIVEDLCAIRRTAVLAMALNVGALIVDKVFKGDMDAVRSRGRKDVTLRLLACHPRAPFSRSTLWRYVGIYEMVRRMPGLVRCKHLTAKHLQSVLGLPHETQERLLVLAAREKWSSRLLREHAENSAPVRVEADTRPRHLRDPVRRLERARTDLNPERLAVAARYAEDELEKLREAIERTRAWCDLLDQWLSGTSWNVELRD